MAGGWEKRARRYTQCPTRPRFVASSLRAFYSEDKFTGTAETLTWKPAVKGGIGA